MTEAKALEKDMPIKAADVYSKSEVDNLILDPAANTTMACVGYDQDVLGGY